MSSAIVPADPANALGEKEEKLMWGSLNKGSTFLQALNSQYCTFFPFYLLLLILAAKNIQFLALPNNK